MGDPEQWQTLIADDIVWELAYAPAIGHPERLSGRAEVMRLFDRTGDYTMAFYAAGAWALLAMGMVLAIRDEPIVRGKRPGSVPVSSTLGRST